MDRRSFITAMLGLGALCVAFLEVISIKVNGPPRWSASQAPPTCKSDWTKCADNRDMANNFDGWFHVKFGCKTAATDRAKYGTPEWPTFFFSSFYPGTNYSTGIVTLIEPDAKFQNGFGAMVHSRVQCEFDLRADKVINVTIAQR
jgi:hypothetical protein